MPMTRAGKKRLLLGVALVAVAGLAAGVYTARQAQIRHDMDRWLNDGIAAYERGDYPGAIENLNAFVSRDKSNVEALTDFADARRRIPMDNDEHIKQAISIAQTALQLKPDSASVQRMLMDLYASLGQWPEARYAADSLLKLDPGNIQAYRIQIQAFDAVGDKTQIIAAAQEMAKAAPGDLDVQREAFNAMARAEAQPAVLSTFVDSSAARFPKSLGVQLMRTGLVLREIDELNPASPKVAERYQKIRDLLTAGASMEPGSVDEARTLILTLDSLGPELRALADQTVDRLIRDPKTAAALSAFAASRKWADGDFEGAGAIVLNTCPSIPDAEDDALGWLALSTLPQAKDAADELKKRQSAAAREWLALASAQKQLDAGDALHAAESLAAAAPTDAEADHADRYLTGVARAALGETAQAAQIWHDLLQIAPNWSAAQDKLVSAYISLGRLEDAAKALFEGSSMGSGTHALEVATMLAERAVSVPGVPPASQIADAALGVREDDPTVQIWAARAYLADGQADKALALVDALLEHGLGADASPALVLASRLDSIDPARGQALRSSIRADASTPINLYQLALLMQRDGHADEARTMMADGLASAPESEKSVWKLFQGLFLDDLGDPAAAPLLLQVSAERPDDLETQQLVLVADSVWKDPGPLDEVIARLRALTGDKATQWRVFRNRRELALLDADAPDMVERANGIVLDLSSVLQADPTNLQALRVSAEASARAGNTARAADTMLKAAAVAPDDLQTALALVRALKLDGRLPEARRNARDLVKLDAPNGELRKQRAEALERFGFPELAAADWKALAGDNNPGATVRLAKSLLEAGQTEQADALVQQVEAATQLPDGLLRDIAAYHALRGHIDQGMQALSKLPESGPQGDRDTIMAEYLAVTSDTAADARALEQQFEASRHGGVWAAIAQAYLRAGELDEARRVTEAGLKLDPASPELATLNTLFKANDAGDPMAFLAMIRSTLRFQASPEVEAAGAVVDQRLAGQIDDETLIKRLQQINAAAPTALGPWQVLAATYFATSRPEDMRTTLLRAMEARSFDPEIARMAMRLFARAGMEDEALLAARNWRERSPNPNFSADQSVAALLVRRGQGAEALNILGPWRERILADRDKYPDDAWILADAMLLSGDTRGAQSVIGPFASTPGHPVAAYIDSSTRITDPDARRDWLARAEQGALAEPGAERLSQLAGAWYALTRITHDPKDAAQSVRFVEAALERPDADQVGLRITQAGAYESANDWARANSLYAALVEQLPDNPDIHNNYATTLLLSKADPNEALAEARKARALATTAGIPADRVRSYIDTEAQALLATGQPAEAVKLYQSILKADPGWNYALVGLSEALLANQQPDQAKATLAQLGAAPLSDDLAPRAQAVRTALGE
ncbi:MAG: tetratricopeptide repeat protein [Phycisphaerales bacterium]|nr:tetratricopeptide repeat protein [Phycisphaerales bacterium]